VKLCPQCAFIYEDDQRLCDMDGTELVHDAPTVLEPRFTPPTRLTISLEATPASLPAESPSRRSPVPLVLLVVLATLLSLVIFAQVYRSRSGHALQTPQPAQLATQDIAPQPTPQSSPADLVSSTSITATLSDQSPESPQESPSTNIAVTRSATRARLASSPVSAGAPGGNSRTVTLRLTNGAAINADEVWERKEGIWYRQGGVVTFLKRSRVSAIERIAAPRSQQQTAVNNGGEKSRKSDDRTTQNQLRIRRLESVETKKASRVNSFLKWTGRILKKPFKS
jgi:hypothetical protein